MTSLYGDLLDVEFVSAANTYTGSPNLDIYGYSLKYGFQGGYLVNPGRVTEDDSMEAHSHDVPEPFGQT